jgi:hypothetical protein
MRWREGEVEKGSLGNRERWKMMMMMGLIKLQNWNNHASFSQ